MLSSFNKMVRSAKSKDRRGLTLIEAAMVLVILALVVGGVMLYYASASTSRKVAQVAGQIGSVQQAVRSAFAGQSDYTGLTDAVILKSMPSSMAASGSDSQLLHAFGGFLNVTPDNAGGGDTSGFKVELLTVPQEACIKLCALDLGRSTYAATCGTTTHKATDAGGIQFTAIDAQAACAPGTDTLSWTFN